MELLHKYASSPSGRKRIKDTYGVDYGGGLSKKKVEAWGERMKVILGKYIHSNIASVDKHDIIVDKPIIDEDGNYKINISLQDVDRASLVPSKYPDGVPDIVLHFTTGWNAQKSTYGFWETAGKVVKSRMTKAPEDFVFDAINVFNKEAVGIAEAVPSGKYKIYADKKNKRSK